MFHNTDTRDIEQETFVAITYSEYKSFLNQKQELERVQQQLKHHMKFRPLKHFKAQSDEPASEHSLNTSQDSSAELQAGQGENTSSTSQILPSDEPNVTAELQTSPPSIQNSDLIQTIVKQVLEQLQRGSGFQDLTPELVEPVNDVSETRPSSEISAIDENLVDQAIILDPADEKLIESVSPHLRPKAQSLLMQLKNFPETIHFNSQGNIVIDNETLDDSNIYKIFPLLFKPTNYAKQPYLQTVVSELATLGLSHLISRYYSAGLLPKGKYHVENRTDLHKKIKQLGSEWYKLDNE